MFETAPVALVSEVGPALEQVIRKLSRHFNEIDDRWSALLREQGVSEDAADLVRGLTLRSHGAKLRAGKWETYTRAMERGGMLLEQRGVPLDEVLTALALYGEACLPRLMAAEEPDLVRALERTTTVAQILVLRGHTKQKAASWRRLDDREKERLSRDLHDEIGHNLIVLKLYLEMITADLDDQKPAAIRTKLEEATALVSQSVESVRRLMLDLGPAVLDEVGLARAVKIYAREFTKRTPIQVRVQTRDVPDTLPSSIETALYRVYQGALSNVAKHSRAALVTVTISRRRSAVRMTIEDDGVGFDPDRRGPAEKTFGLTAMRERTELLGGTIRILSWPKRGRAARHGTRIEVELPLNEAATGA